MDHPRAFACEARTFVSANFWRRRAPGIERPRNSDKKSASPRNSAIHKSHYGKTGATKNRCYERSGARFCNPSTPDAAEWRGGPSVFRERKVRGSQAVGETSSPTRGTQQRGPRDALHCFRRFMQGAISPPRPPHGAERRSTWRKFMQNSGLARSVGKIR